MILGGAAKSRASEFAGGLVYRCAVPGTSRAKWAWLADTHVPGDESVATGGRRPAETLRRVVREVAEAAPRGVLINGDLAWSSGRPTDYGRLLQELRPLARDAVVVLGMGNHDSRRNLLAAVTGGAEPAPARLAAVVDAPPYRFVMLDSLIDTSEVGGEIGSAQLGWLDSVLAEEAASRTFVFVHHPGRSASAGCRDFDALERAAARRPGVQALVTGHEHEFFLRRAGGVPHVGLPSAGFAFEPATPCGWVEALLSERRIEIRLHGGGAESLHELGWRPSCAAP